VSDINTVLGEVPYSTTLLLDDCVVSADLHPGPPPKLLTDVGLTA